MNIEDKNKESQRIKIKEKAKERRKSERINRRNAKNRIRMRKMFSFLALFLFIIFIMSGAINQRNTMGDIINFGRFSGKGIGEKIISIITNDSDYVEINKDGVYIKDEVIDK